MAEINHSIGINASVQSVQKALNSIDGLKGWWTTQVSGEVEQGGTIQFRFGDHGGPDMLVTKNSPHQISWECTSGPEEWLKTQLHFDIKEVEDQIMVFFSHSGWKETSPFHHHCSTKWAVFLLSLKKYLEDGEGFAYPKDIKITNMN